MESYGDEIFKDLDDRFFALYESVDPAALRIAWIRAHAAELQWGVEG